MRIKATQYSNEYIVEKSKEYGSLKELRDSSFGFYQLVRRRGLLEEVRNLFPPETFPRKKQKLKEVEPKERKKPGRKPKDPVEKASRQLQLYKHTFENGVKVCGRCFARDPKTPKSVLCKDCYRVYARKHAYEQPHTPWNVRQEFCNTTIRHHEKTFELGIKVDEKLERYLTMVGYGFLFKEVDENMYK